jgi:hypothetical protein
MIIDEEFLTHTGVKGMKWGVRRANKKSAKVAKKAAKAKAEKEFTDMVIKDIGGRPLNHLYAVGGQNSRVVTIMTGKEFVERASLGMKFDTINSTGMAIKDET